MIKIKHYVILSAAIYATITTSCSERPESAENPAYARPDDKELLDLFHTWEAGNIQHATDLVSRLGDPQNIRTKNGVMTYSWCGSDEYWLFAGVDPKTKTVTGVSVQSRY